MVTRMRELSVQMHNGIYTTADRANANLETAQLLEEITKITDYTAFNEVTLLDGSYSSEIRAGNTNPEVMAIVISDIGITGLATGLATITLTTATNAEAAVTILDTAIENLATHQATLGSKLNRLQHNISYLSDASVLTEQARGRIVDADFALESTSLAKQQILNNASTAMLAQANQSKGTLMQLIQG